MKGMRHIGRNTAQGGEQAQRSEVQRADRAHRIDAQSAERARRSERAQRILRRTEWFWWFWTAVVASLLIIGGAAAFSNHPALLRTPGGLVMAALALAYMGWYWLFAYLRGRLGWPVPWPLAYLYLVIGLALTAGLLTFDLTFVSLIYPIIGLSVGLLSTRASLPAVGAAVLLHMHVYHLLPPAASERDWSSAGWSIFGLAMGIGISYSMAALFRQRYEREELIDELQEAHERLRASAAQEVELAALRERNRLAREMHDSLGHALVLIAIKIEAAQRLQAVDAERAAAEWEDTKALVRATMADLRNSLAGLRLPALEEQPFAPALAELCKDLSRRTALDITCAIDERAAVLDRPIQEALYRVAQEGLANVAKHARAQHAWLSVGVRSDVATLEVGDDGVGLGASPTEGGRGSHYGLLGMRERVESLGGVLTLGPRPDGGTVLRASVPLEARVPRETVGISL